MHFRQVAMLNRSWLSSWRMNLHAFRNKRQFLYWKNGTVSGLISRHAVGMINQTEAEGEIFRLFRCGIDLFGSQSPNINHSPGLRLFKCLRTAAREEGRWVETHPLGRLGNNSSADCFFRCERRWFFKEILEIFKNDSRNFFFEKKSAPGQWRSGHFRRVWTLTP